MNGSARIFAGGSYVSSVLVAPPVGRHDAEQRHAVRVDREHAHADPSRPRASSRTCALGKSAAHHVPAASRARLDGRRRSRAGRCRSHVREPSVFAWPAVFHVASVAMRKRRHLRRPSSGTSCASITPSWFGVHSAVSPSLARRVAAVGHRAHRRAPAPHVPSALQKWDGHWSSVVQLVPPPPPPTPSCCRAAQTQAAKRRRHGRHATTGTVGAVKRILQRSKHLALRCTMPGRVRSARGDGPDQEVRQPAALRHSDSRYVTLDELADEDPRRARSSASSTPRPARTSPRRR